MKENIIITEQKVNSYFERLGGLYLLIEVQNKRSENLSFGKGLNEIVQWSFESHKQGKKLIFIGNGGSASIASHMAIDYWKNGGIRSTCFNEASLLTCLSNDYGYEYVFSKPIQMFAQRGDLVIAISSSGKSKNILNAVDAAREKECGVITLSGFKTDNPLRRCGDINFYVPSSSYGFVELSHLSICHAALDLACEYQKEIYGK